VVRSISVEHDSSLRDCIALGESELPAGVDLWTTVDRVGSRSSRRLPDSLGSLEVLVSQWLLPPSFPLFLDVGCQVSAKAQGRPEQAIGLHTTHQLRGAAVSRLISRGEGRRRCYFGVPCPILLAVSMAGGSVELTWTLFVGAPKSPGKGSIGRLRLGCSGFSCHWYHFSRFETPESCHL